MAKWERRGLQNLDEPVQSRPWPPDERLKYAWVFYLKRTSLKNDVSLYFFDYESKYDPALCDEFCPAPIDDELAQRLKDVALTAHHMIDARHLSRTDMIVDNDGTIWFLETNTIPGLTSASLTPKAITAAGLKLEDLLTVWIDDVLKEKTA